MKDELGGKILIQFVELRPKLVVPQQMTVVKRKEQKAQQSVP